MKTIAWCSAKGGCGKSTLATHLAVAAFHKGYATTLLDLDPQSSAAQWSDTRQAEQPVVVSIPPSRLAKTLETAAANGIQITVIDSAPHATEAMMEICDAADLVLVPSRPGILDIRAVRMTAKIAHLSGKTAYAVLNQAPHRAPLLMADASRALASAGLVVAPVMIHARSVFGHCLIGGLTAQEYEPGSKAAQEIDALFAWIGELLAI